MTDAVRRAAPTPWWPVAGLAAMAVALGAALVAWLAGAWDPVAVLADARAYATLRPFAAAAIFALCFVVTVTLAVPIVPIMCIAAGAMFGPWIALPLVVACKVSGGTASMLVVRHALRETLARRFPELGRRFDGLRPGSDATALLAARLIPALPFVLVNAAVGMSRMPARTFALVSAVGVLPTSALFVFTGAELGAVASPADALSPSRVVMLALLAAAVLIARHPGLPRLLRRYGVYRPS